MDEKEAEARPLMGTIFLVSDTRWKAKVSGFVFSCAKLEIICKLEEF